MSASINHHRPVPAGFLFSNLMRTKTDSALAATNSLLLRRFDKSSQRKNPGAETKNYAKGKKSQHLSKRSPIFKDKIYSSFYRGDTHDDFLYGHGHSRACPDGLPFDHGYLPADPIYPQFYPSNRRRV